MIRNRTYRVVDGVRVEGTWRPVFIEDGGTYFPTDLLVYADGAIYCWEMVDLDGLAEKLRSGWVSVDPGPDARASRYGLASWRFSDPISHLTPEDLLAEVADLIEELNDRPDSRDRCRTALDRYLETRGRDDLLALREAYLAVPAHHRRFLGDMDMKDRPLRRLCGIDQADWEPPAEPGPELDWVMDYLEEHRPWSRKAPLPRRKAIDDPETDRRSILRLTPDRYRDPDTAPPTQRLHNEFPLPVTVAGAAYPNLEQAYLALSVTAEADRAAVRKAGSGSAASAIVAASASRVLDWHLVRAAVMMRLLRMKFEQHPDLVGVLLGTGDARIDYTDHDSKFWSLGPEPGGNWMGRLLELLRSELALAASGVDLCGAGSAVDTAEVLEVRLGR